MEEKGVRLAHRVQLEDDALEVLAQFARERRLPVRRQLHRPVAEFRERVQQRRAAKVRAHTLAGRERQRREVRDALSARHARERHFRVRILTLTRVRVRVRGGRTGTETGTGRSTWVRRGVGSCGHIRDQEGDTRIKYTECTEKKRRNAQEAYEHRVQATGPRRSAEGGR